MTQPLTDRERVERFRAFWHRDAVDRPLVGTTISTFPSFRAVRREKGFLSPADLDVATNLRELDEEWEQWHGVMGDALWVATPIWAFPWHLCLAGCPVERDADNIWAHPSVDDWSQLERVRFDPANPWFLKLAEFQRAMAAHGAGRYAAGLGPLLLGPCDMLMQVRGQERLALDLYDAPAMVQALAKRCVDLTIAATEALYDLVPRYHDGYAGTSRYFWAPDKMIEGAEDVSFMMSPAMHRRFIVPIHEALGRQFPHHMVHLHSAQLHTVPNLLETEGVHAIEITPDFGEDMRPYLPLMARILERKPLLLHGVMTAEVMREIIAALPARGLALFCRCNDPAAAKNLLAALA
ncbi:MAG: hypothetical protein ACYC3S_16855 [Chloroflexota bacterium]